MAAEVGTAFVSVVPSARGFGSKLSSALRGPSQQAGRQAGGTIATGVTSKFSVIGGALGAAFAVSGVKRAIGEVVGQASDLGESVNAVNVVFGRSAAGVLKLGENAAKSVGLSNAEFNGLAVQFSNFAKAVAGPGGDVVGTLDDMTGRAADFASVMNLEVAEAATIFQSGLAGETEPLRRFGIDLSAATVEAYALAEGIAQPGEKMTEQQKVLARYGLLMRETANTQDDFANTSDSLANRQRILGAAWDDLKARLGAGLLPVMEAGAALLQRFVEAAGPLATTIAERVAPAVQGFRDALSGLGGDGGGPLATVVEFVRDLAPTFADIGRNIMSVAGPAFDRIGAIVRDQLLPAFERFLPVVTPIAQWLLQTLGSAVVGAMQGAFQVIEGVLTAISGVFDVFASAVRGDWSGLWDGIKRIVSGVFKAILGAVKVWWHAGILNLFRGGIKSLLSGWRKGLDGVRNVAKAALDAVKRLVQTGLNAVGRTFTTVLRTVGTTVRSGMQAVRQVFTTVLNAVRSVVTGGMAAVRNVIQSAMQAARSRVQSALSTIRSAFSAAWSAVRSGVSAAFSAIVTTIRSRIATAIATVRGIRSRITGFFSSAGSWLTGAGRAIIQGLIDGITAMVDRVRSAIGSVTSTVARFLPGSPVKEGPLTVLNRGRAGGQIVEMLADGITGRTRTATSAADHVAGRVAARLTPTGGPGTFTNVAAPRQPATTAAAPAVPAGPSHLVIVDADGQLIGRMRVEADRRIAGAFTGAVAAARAG